MFKEKSKKWGWLLVLLVAVVSFCFVHKARADVTVILTPPSVRSISGVPVTSAIPQTTDTTPVFRGSCNIPNAIMEYRIKIDGDFILGSGGADANGNWEWTCPQGLSLGMYTLYITATDPKDSSITASTTQKFEVVKKGTVSPTTGSSFVLIVALALVATLIIVGVYLCFRRRPKRA